MPRLMGSRHLGPQTLSRLASKHLWLGPALKARTYAPRPVGRKSWACGVSPELLDNCKLHEWNKCHSVRYCGKSTSGLRLAGTQNPVQALSGCTIVVVA
jgi:hypothetical protein